MYICIYTLAISNTLFRKYIFIEMNTSLKLEPVYHFISHSGEAKLSNCSRLFGLKIWTFLSKMLRRIRMTWIQMIHPSLLTFTQELRTSNPQWPFSSCQFMWLEWWGTLGRLSASLRKPAFYWKKLHGFPLLTHSDSSVQGTTH